MISMTAKPVTEAIYQDLKSRLARLRKAANRAPKLAVVLVGEDPASVVYTNRKGQMAASLGMEHETITFPANASPSAVESKIAELNANPQVDGILVQRPLPKVFDEEKVLHWVDPAKDVDAFHPTNVGRLRLGLSCFQPCTPAGIMRLLSFYKIPLEGKTVCVIGRSSIVGNPMATLLVQANATLIQCHSRTRDLKSFTAQADVLIAAAGKMHLIQREHIKPGSTVIDVGMHRMENGKLTGDVDFDSVSSLVHAITPVPGGVGPMTIAVLMENTVYSAEMRESVC